MIGTFILTIHSVPFWLVQLFNFQISFSCQVAGIVDILNVTTR